MYIGEVEIWRGRAHRRCTVSLMWLSVSRSISGTGETTHSSVFTYLSARMRALARTSSPKMGVYQGHMAFSVSWR